MSLQVDTKKIEEIIRHVSATEVMPRFKNLQAGDIREKNPGDFVTVADEASERAFTKLLAEALPGSLVVGEEAVSADVSVLEKMKDDKPVWVIDPIDGTYNYSHGRSKFGILIALVQNGVTQYGWAFDAPGNRMAMAQKGHGTFIDGKRITLECKATEMKALVGQGGGAHAWHFDPVRPMVKDIINYRCSLHDFMNVLTGGADFLVHVGKSTPWDQAAGCLMIEEAGGYVAMDDDAKPYSPTHFGPAFLLAAPTKQWWEKLHTALYSQLRKK